MPTKRVTKPKTAKVVFELPAAVHAEKVALCGEFNDWSTDTILLERDEAGCWHATVPLELGHSYRYRYLIDDEKWENGWHADAYVPNDHGSEDSVVVVAPQPVRRTSAPRTKTASETTRPEALHLD
jgi:1,4-alpha-glucan branching enzyme